LMGLQSATHLAPSGKDSVLMRMPEKIRNNTLKTGLLFTKADDHK